MPVDPLSIFKIQRLVSKSQVVHINSPFPILETFAAIFGKVSRKRVVVTYHMDAIIDKHGKSTIVSVVMKVLESVYYALSSFPTLSLADSIVVNAGEYVRYSKHLQPFEEKIRVIHQGVDIDLLRTASPSMARELRSRYGSENGKIVLFVGRLVPYKGLDVLIEAASIITRECPQNVHFLIGGKGPERERLEQMASQRGECDIRFLGYVDDEVLPSLYKAADVVACPSVSALESTPITLLEAMALGVPVVGTTIGGTAEALMEAGNNAAVVQPCNHAQLADAITRLLRVPSTRQRDRVQVKGRGWDDTCEDYVKLWQQQVIKGAADTPPVGPIGIMDAAKLTRLYVALPEGSKEYFHPFPFNFGTAILFLYMPISRFLITLWPSAGFITVRARVQPSRDLVGFAYVHVRRRYRRMKFEGTLGIVVSDLQRGRGVGDLLMNRLLRECDQMGIRSIKLTVMAQNVIAQKLYLKHGFRIIGYTSNDSWRGQALENLAMELAQ